MSIGRGDAIDFYRKLGFETIGHRPFTVGTMV
jgi:hypothetical protein